MGSIAGLPVPSGVGLRGHRCKGMWLDYGELDQLEDTVFDQNELKGSLMFRSFRGDLLCPKCQRPMQFFNYRAYDLELDFCDQEHGVWLDADEEKRVLELMEQRMKRKMKWGDLARGERGPPDLHRRKILGRFLNQMKGE